jgi:hypothetical protein
MDASVAQEIIPSLHLNAASFPQNIAELARKSTPGSKCLEVVCAKTIRQMSKSI